MSQTLCVFRLVAPMIVARIGMAATAGLATVFVHLRQGKEGSKQGLSSSIPEDKKYLSQGGIHVR